MAGGAYTRPIRWEPGTFLRPCDLCGIRFRANQLIRSTDGKFRCLRWCAEQTQLDRDRISAAASRRREAPPPPFGAPYLFRDLYGTEGILFDFLANQAVVDSGWTGGLRMGAAPASTMRGLGSTQVTQGSYSPGGLGEAMRYLYGLIVENRRPLQWISRAKVKLRELADFAIANQNGFGINPTFTKSNEVRFGSVLLPGNTVYLAPSQGQMGLGFLYAYQALGDIKYLTSARAMADFVTNLQHGGLLTSNFSSTDAAGTSRISYGTWTEQTNATATVFSQRFTPSTLVVLEFLKTLYGLVGDEMHGADTTLTALFTQAPQQLLSVSMSSARAFWSAGCFDATAGATVNGFSTTTPRERFFSFPSTIPGFASNDGSWAFQNALGSAGTGTLITASNWALGLRALYVYEGYSTQVAALWSYLMSFASNPTFQATTTSRGLDAPTALSLLGNYDPKLSLTTLLQVRTPVTFTSSTQNGSSQYDWQCAGILAPIQGVQDPGSLDAAKDYVTKGVVFPTDYDYGRNGTDYFMCQGLSGLSGQIGANPQAVVDWRADLAASVGQMFRYGNVPSQTTQV